MWLVTHFSLEARGALQKVARQETLRDTPQSTASGKSFLEVSSEPSSAPQPKKRQNAAGTSDHGASIAERGPGFSGATAPATSLREPKQSEQVVGGQRIGKVCTFGMDDTSDEEVMTVRCISQCVRSLLEIQELAPMLSKP